MSNFRYDRLVQKALISVVRDVLADVAVNGLTDNHHFYIRFMTNHPKTVVPKFLRDQHPEEIMIVLQYQFWNLKVEKSHFSVDLNFDGIRETLVIPFDALMAFVDPSVKFALQFTLRMISQIDDEFPTDDGPNGGKSDNNPSEKISSDDNIISFDSLRKK